MDGTVLDTLEDLYDSINHSLEMCSLPPVKRELVRQGLGNGAVYLVNCCVPENCTSELRQQVLDVYKPWYDAHCRIKTKPYAGILSVMQELRKQGVRLAIISNKPDTAVQELAEVFFSDLLDVVVGETPSIRRKPAPDTVLMAARQMELSTQDCIYVGDSEVDIQTARNAGMDCISVTWGFRDEDQLLAAGAEHLIHSPKELLRFIF